MFVKICGIRDLPALQAALEAGADAVGFVFHRPSRRYLAPPAAVPLATVAGGRALKVGVFAGEPPLEIAGLAAAVPLDHVQVHARDAAEVARVRDALRLVGRPLGLILAVKVSGREGDGDEPEEGLRRAARLIREVGPDMALVEGAGGGLAGGTGRPWDWSLLRSLDAELAGRVPLLLAGGLTPANVREAARAARPFGVDVASGVETDGRKDPEKIRAFVREAKEATTDGRPR